MTGIEPHDITFCVQGPVSLGENGKNLTQDLISSIKSFFPGSPIVFSTWQGEPVEFAQDCTLIVSSDPGSSLRYLNSKSANFNNLNRQIISTRAGLEQIETEYSVKIRSDLVFTNSNLAQVLSRLPFTPRESKYRIFERYIVVVDRLLFSPRKSPNPLLHVTDMMLAGLTHDLRQFWSAKPMTLAQETFHAKAPSERQEQVGHHAAEFRAEQYLFSDLIRRKLGVALGAIDTESTDFPLTVEELFGSNLIPFRMPSLGLAIRKPSYPWNSWNSWVSSLYAYTYKDWKKSAKKLGVLFRPPASVVTPEFFSEIAASSFRLGFNFAPGSHRERARSK